MTQDRLNTFLLRRVRKYKLVKMGNTENMCQFFHNDTRMHNFGFFEQFLALISLQENNFSQQWSFAVASDQTVV